MTQIHLYTQCYEHKPNCMLVMSYMHVWLMDCQTPVDMHIIVCFMQSVSIPQWGSSNYIVSPVCLHATILVTVLVFTCCKGPCIHWASREHSTSTEPSLVDSETVVYTFLQSIKMCTSDDQYPTCLHQHRSHMWYCCVWQGAMYVRCTEVGDTTAAERFCRPIVTDATCDTGH